MIEKLFRENLITEDIVKIESYINETWIYLSTKLEVRLSELFPEPDNKGLKHIWKYGSADLVVRRNGKVIAIIETGGNHHFQDEKQIKKRT